MSTGRTRTPLAAARRIGYRQLAHLAVEVSDRDRAILGALARLRYATTRQLQRLWLDPDAASPLAAARAAQRELARLHRLGLIDRLGRRIGGVRAGSAGYVWRLTPAGARLIDAPARRRRMGEPGLQNLTHELEVTELVVALHEHARTGAFALVAIETEPDCWRAYTGRSGRLWLKPDLRVTLAKPDVHLHWFIEVDRGTHGHAALVRKITAYVTAWREGTEQDRVGCFPGVAWLTPERARAERIQALCASTPGVPAGMFTATPAAGALTTLTREQSHEGDPVGH